MISPCLVVVGQDDDAPASEKLREVAAPFPGAAWIACRGQTELTEPVGILLALGNEDRLIRRGQQLGQPIGHRARALGRPFPTAAAIRSALAKILWIAKPGDLE